MMRAGYAESRVPGAAKETSRNGIKRPERLERSGRSQVSERPAHAGQRIGQKFALVMLSLSKGYRSRFYRFGGSI